MGKVRLGEVCQIVSGSTPKTSINEYWDGDLDWITPAELNENSFILDGSVRKITELGAEKTGLKPFPQGTVILSSRAPIGKVAIAGKEMYCNQGFKNLICSDEIYNEFLFWFLKGKTEYLNSLGRGATFKEISKGIVENIEISLPDFDEQIHAAEILKKCWSIIQLKKQELSELDGLIKSRFVELFGDTKSNERKWNTLPLHKVLESGSSVSYGIVQTGDDIEGGVPVFRPIDIAGGKIPRREQLKRTANDISNQYSRTLLKGYELLITVRGSVGETFRVTSEFAGCNVGRNIVPLRFDTEIVDYSFMQHFFAQEGTKRVLESMTKGIALQGLNMSEFRETDVIIPAMSLQQQFAAFVEQTDKSKFEVQKSLEETQLLMDALMQKYFG